MNRPVRLKMSVAGKRLGVENVPLELRFFFRPGPRREDRTEILRSCNYEMVCHVDVCV